LNKYAYGTGTALGTRGTRTVGKRESRKTGGEGEKREGKRTEEDEKRTKYKVYRGIVDSRTAKK
jgi:hypothetical protein